MFPLLGAAGALYLLKKGIDALVDDDDDEESYESEEEKKNDFRRRMQEGKKRAAAKRKKHEAAKERMAKNLDDIKNHLSTSVGMDGEKVFNRLKFEFSSFNYKDFESDFDKINTDINECIKKAIEADYKSKIEKLNNDINTLTKYIEDLSSK